MLFCLRNPKTLEHNRRGKELYNEATSMVESRRPQFEAALPFLWKYGQEYKDSLVAIVKRNAVSQSRNDDDMSDDGDGSRISLLKTLKYTQRRNRKLADEAEEKPAEEAEEDGDDGLEDDEEREDLRDKSFTN